MVGPGEVDAELEPEVKEECEGKYGRDHQGQDHGDTGRRGGGGGQDIPGVQAPGVCNQRWG